MSSKPISAAVSITLASALLLVFLAGLPARFVTRAQSPAAPNEVPNPPGIGDAWVFANTFDHGCADGDTFFDTFTYLVTGSTYTFHAVVSSGANIYMDYLETTQPVTSGADSLILFADNSGGTANASFPLPSGTPVSVTMTLLQGLSRTPVYRTVLSYTCDTGATQVLESGPLSPNLPVLNFETLSGNGCQPASLTLNLFANARTGTTYILDAVLRDSSQVYMDYFRTQTLDTGPTTFILDDYDDRGLQTAPFDLPSGNITATLTLRDASAQPLYRSDVILDCITSFDSRAIATPFQPAQSALTLVDRVVGGCAAGIPTFNATLWTESSVAYRYEILVQRGSSVYMDYYRADPNRLPGMNLFILESASDRGRQNALFPLTPGEPVQVTLGLYDPQGKPLYATRFDYDCAGAGTVSGLIERDYYQRFLPLEWKGALP